MATYTVVAGDTLSGIAAKLNANGQFTGSWQDLYQANLAVVGSNPNLIFPGQVLTIPGTDAGGESGSSGGSSSASGAAGGTNLPLAPGTVRVGSSVIPQGARLIKVLGAGGAEAEYYLAYNVFGMPLTFLIGNQARFNELFPGTGAFNNFSTMTRSEFTSSDNFQFLSGTVDEILGARESLQVQIQRELDALGFEDLPAWITGDDEAMQLVVQSVREGWSAGRLAVALTETGGFADRFPGFDQFTEFTTSDSVLENVALYLEREADIASVLQQYRGPSANISPGFVGELLATGWHPDELSAVLEAERQINTNPEALDELNVLLARAGLDPVDESEFLDIVLDNPQALPVEVFEVINDTLRQVALANQGVDITAELAEFLGRGSSLGVAAEGAFSEAARIAALNIARNATDIELDRYGLTRDDIVAAVFNETTLGGKPSTEIESILARLSRERDFASRGFDEFSTFQDEQGRLRTLGLAGL